MEQTRALNALEPFLALAKSANSPRAAADLITQATSAPNTYVFAELLQTANIQALRDSQDYASYLRLLEVFAWGTWAEYQENQSNLPTLSAQQTQKLKLLSLLPLAADPTNLSYDTLTSALTLTPPELESLLIAALYAPLLTGTLDPSAQRAHLTSVAPLRDLAPGSVPTMDKALGEWGARCEDSLGALEAEIEAVRAKARSREQGRAREAALRERVEAVVEEGVKGKGKGSVLGEEMDVDEEGVGGGEMGGKARERRRGGGGGVFGGKR